MLLLNYYIVQYGAELSRCEGFLQEGVYSRVNGIPLSNTIERNAAHENHMHVSRGTACPWRLMSTLHHLELLVPPCQLQAAHSCHCHIHQYGIKIARCISVDKALETFNPVVCCLNIVFVQHQQLR